MEKRDYQDDFELFLQEEVKQHRMYPSDHLWKNIRTELHGNKSWPALTFISLFIISALTVATVINTQPKSKNPVPVFEKTLVAIASPLIVSELKESTKAIGAKFKMANRPTKNAAGQINKDTEKLITIQPIANPSTSEQSTAKEVNATPATITASIISESLASKQGDKNKPSKLIILPEASGDKTEKLLSDIHAQISSSPEQTLATSAQFLPIANQPEASFKALQSSRLSARSNRSKLGVQFYFTPSKSYRKLSDDLVKEVIQPAVSQSSSQNVPLNAGTTANVNQVVRHKPGLGIELGFAGIYAISSNLRLTTGAQLNIRRYQIETFQSLTQDLTSVALVNNRSVETISFYSAYNNNTGFKKTELSNSVYQVSIPIGIQWDLIRGKRLGLYSEASAQPTFIINNNTYLLSTDYKHYGDGSEFMRKWNINTSLGLMINYQTGSTSIQLGPQIRYQHLPTYSNAYPIKENLLDYGIKFGITKQLH